jgi:predicted esterase
MSEPDFAPTRYQLLSLYNQGAYVEALDLLEREATRFPQQGLMYHWRMCLAARANDPDKALGAFQEALSRGYWYPARLLRDDEDLQSLQGLPRFEEMVAVSLERMAKAELSSTSQLLVIPPEGMAASPAPLLIGLHGNSQSAQIAAEDWHTLHKRGWTLALPQSSQLLTADAYMWDDFARGASEVERLCGELVGNQSVDPTRILLGGFSAGGGLAIQLAISGTLNARGFLVIGPYLRDLEVLSPYFATARNRGIRGYIVMGLEEPAEGQELMLRTAALLKDNGIPCEIERHAKLGHAFPPDFDATLQKALSFLLPK